MLQRWHSPRLLLRLAICFYRCSIRLLVWLYLSRLRCLLRWNLLGFSLPSPERSYAVVLDPPPTESLGRRNGSKPSSSLESSGGCNYGRGRLGVLLYINVCLICLRKNTHRVTADRIPLKAGHHRKHFPQIKRLRVVGISNEPTPRQACRIVIYKREAEHQRYP